MARRSGIQAVTIFPDRAAARTQEESFMLAKFTSLVIERDMHDLHGLAARKPLYVVGPLNRIAIAGDDGFNMPTAPIIR